MSNTPAPWHAYPIENGTWGIVQVHKPPQTSTPIELSVENANKIAAAPDLEKACKLFIEWDNHGIEIGIEFREVRKAIYDSVAKAKGE